MHRKIIFFGNSSFSLPVLQSLIEKQIPLIAIVTSPDKPKGRHLLPAPNPVKEFALRYKLLIFESLKELEANFDTAASDTIPIGLVAAYGRIIKTNLLNRFNTQIYNIHPSLLPKYRGPSPLQFQLIDNIPDTGVSLIQMDEQVDHGPIIAQIKCPISTQDTSVTLGEKLFLQGAGLFIDFYQNPEKYSPIPQDHTQATFTRLLTKEDGFVEFASFQKDIALKDEKLFSKFKAFYPWPGVWTKNPQGKRIKLIEIYPKVRTRLEGQN
jgi:methionyl-tRNA formyltransferase